MATNNTQKRLNKHLRYLLFCLPFTGLLLLPRVGNYLPFSFLQYSWVQLLICLPVYIAGMKYFGLSAVKSIRKCKPNRNVWIATGATAAFLYSLAGTVMGLGPAYLFYETAAAVITLVF